MAFGPSSDADTFRRAFFALHHRRDLVLRRPVRRTALFAQPSRWRIGIERVRGWGPYRYCLPDHRTGER
jgi:hypothetical protein